MKNSILVFIDLQEGNTATLAQLVQQFGDAVTGPLSQLLAANEVTEQQTPTGKAFTLTTGDGTYIVPAATGIPDDVTGLMKALNAGLKAGNVNNEVGGGAAVGGAALSTFLDGLSSRGFTAGSVAIDLYIHAQLARILANNLRDDPRVTQSAIDRLLHSTETLQWLADVINKGGVGVATGGAGPMPEVGTGLDDVPAVAPALGPQT